MHLLEKGRRGGAETTLVEKRLRIGVEWGEGLPEGGDTGKVARGEEVRYAGLFEEWREEVCRRVALEAQSDHIV
jgi:hypothetical protein